MLVAGPSINTWNWGWESTPQNPIFVFSAQLRAAPSFSGGTAQIWHMSQHCKAAPATFSYWGGAVKMKKLPPFQAWYLMAWAELVSSSSAQGVRPLAVISCGQEATSTFISQLMGTEEDYLEEHNMFWGHRTLRLLTSDTEQVGEHPSLAGLPPVRCFAWSYDLLSSVIHYILTARANGRCTPARPSFCWWHLEPARDNTYPWQLLGASPTACMPAEKSFVPFLPLQL